jgi:hypothetical protein
MKSLFAGISRLLFVVLALSPGGIELRAQVQQYEYQWTNFAGLPGGMGNADGTGTVARFNNPTGVAVDANGNTYPKPGNG